MNSVWASFLIGLVIGLLIAGFVTYKVEEDKILVMENKYQQAVTQAQNNVIIKAGSSSLVNSQIGADYDKQTQGIFSKWVSTPVIVQPHTTSDSVPKVSVASKSVNAAPSKCKINLQLCNIEVNEWQKWCSSQARIYNGTDCLGK